MAEGLAPGAIAWQVALWQGLHPNQLYMWRRELAGEAAAASCCRALGREPVGLIEHSAKACAKRVLRSCRKIGENVGNAMESKSGRDRCGQGEPGVSDSR